MTIFAEARGEATLRRRAAMQILAFGPGLGARLGRLASDASDGFRVKGQRAKPAKRLRTTQRRCFKRCFFRVRLEELRAAKSLKSDLLL